MTLSGSISHILSNMIIPKTKSQCKNGKYEVQQRSLKTVKLLGFFLLFSVTVFFACVSHVMY